MHVLFLRPPPPLYAFLPVVMFSVLFGLSMDYEVYTVREVGNAQEVSSARFTLLAMTCMPALLGCRWSPLS